MVDRNMARVELKDARIDKLMSRPEEILGHELGRNLVNSIGLSMHAARTDFSASILFGSGRPVVLCS